MPFIPEPELCHPQQGAFARAVCWIQAHVQGLCEKDEPVLTIDDQFTLSNIYEDAHLCDYISRFSDDLALRPPQEQRVALAEYARACPDQPIDPAVHALLAQVVPRRAAVALWFWRKFTYGTNCQCCWAYRVVATAIIAAIGGAALGGLAVYAY
jgi:hypothetical protein